MNAKKVLFLGTVCSAMVSLNAQTILFNDFSAVTPGSYLSGGATPNPELGVDPLLGRTYGDAGFASHTTVVNATGGVGNSAYATGNADPAIRSVLTGTTTTTTSFSMQFQFGTNGTNFGNLHLMVGAGWTNSNLNYFNAMGPDSFVVGLKQDGAVDTFNRGGGVFAVASSFNAPVPINETHMELNPGEWYELSFDLTFDGTNTWIVEDLNLLSWGADGLTGGGLVGSVASYSIDPTNPRSVNLDTNTSAWAAFFGNRDRNTPGIDNLSAVAVPEPATYAFAFGLVMLGIAVVRRWQRKPESTDA